MQDSSSSASLTTDSAGSGQASRSTESAAVVVLGMHRSGTSALTRVLNLLGVDLGENLMQAAAGNETGFWEHQGVVDRHAALLNAFGMTWDDPRRLPAGWLESEAAATAVEDLIALLKDEFGGAALWGVKDPRMCRFLPLWRQVFEALDAAPRYVILLRHPLEIVRSLHQRDHMTEGRGLLLWLRHALEAEASSRGAPRVFLRYADLMRDWKPVARTIADGLDLPLALKSRKAASAIKDFIRPSMRHYSLDMDALAEDPRLLHWAGAVHAALDAAANGEDTDLAETLDRIASELDTAGYYFDDTIAEAAPREDRLREEIHELHTRLNEREKWAAERERWVEERNQAIIAKDGVIKELGDSLDAQVAAVGVQDASIRDLHARLRDLDARNEEMQGEIARMHQNFLHVGQTWSWKLTRPFRGLARVGFGILGMFNLLRHEMIPMATYHLRRAGPGRYRAETSAPQIVLSSRRHRLPRGWVEVEYDIKARRIVSPQLFFDDGDGFRESTRMRLPPTRSGNGKAIVRLPNTVTGLRLDPVHFIGEFDLGPIRIRELNGPALAIGLVLRKFREAGQRTNGFAWLWDLVRTAFKRGGFLELKKAIRHNATEPLRGYDNWSQTYSELSEADVEAINRHIAALSHTPLLSVVMPTYNTPPETLRKAIDSVREQIYQRWELCIADDASSNEDTLALLREIDGSDERIKISFRDTNGHISRASNTALETAEGEFVVLLDHDDELTSHALYMIVAELNRYPNADIIYSDEDKIDDDDIADHPYFKPDYSPDMLLSQNYINHLGAYRRALVEQVGGFRPDFDGSQDYDLALRVIEHSKPENVRHIPFVLYHWRSMEGSVAAGEEEKTYALDAARKAISEHLERREIAATVVAGQDQYSHRVIYDLPEEPPKVSLIVPTRDRVNLLKMIVDGVREKNDYPNWELLIVDNGSEEQATTDYLADISRDQRISVLRDDGPFNFSRLNNRAAKMTDGEIIGLVNNDIEPISEDWLSEMVRQVIQPGVGAVGAKLYYPNDTLQHGGVIVGLGGVAGHFDKGLPRDRRGYFGRAMLVQNFSAVTAACMLVPRAVYKEVGGLDEVHLAVAFNDVDFCLKIREAGHRLVWTPYAELYHHESVSRGHDTAPEKVDRFAAEVRVMQERWQTKFEADPFYSPNLTQDRERPVIADPPRIERPWADYYEA